MFPRLLEWLSWPLCLASSAPPASSLAVLLPHCLPVPSTPQPWPTLFPLPQTRSPYPLIRIQSSSSKARFKYRFFRDALPNHKCPDACSSSVTSSDVAALLPPELMLACVVSSVCPPHCPQASQACLGPLPIAPRTRLPPVMPRVCGPWDAWLARSVQPLPGPGSGICSLPGVCQGLLGARLQGLKKMLDWVSRAKGEQVSAVEGSLLCGPGGSVPPEGPDPSQGWT